MNGAVLIAPFPLQEKTMADVEATEAPKKRGRPKKEETVPARVLRGYFPEADVKITKGTIVDVSKDDLIAGMELGTLERVK